MALAIGPITGGFIAEKLDWSWIFFVNIPVGIVGFILARWAIDESRDMSREQRLDVPGPRDVRGRAVLAHIRAHRVEHIRLDVAPHSRPVRHRGRRARRDSFSSSATQRVPMLDLDAVQELDLHGLESRDVPHRARDVRDLLLQLVCSCRTSSATRRSRPARSFLPMTLLIILVAPWAGKLSDQRRLAVVHRRRHGARRRSRSSSSRSSTPIRRSGTSCPASSSEGSGWRWQ